MAKLSLMFENRSLNEFSLTRGTMTIGRLPDNIIQIDNPAVSGHHARIYWNLGEFVVEDNDSLNGTFINDQRIKQQTLHHADRILIGKHILVFDAEPNKPVAADTSAYVGPALPKLDGTAMLDTKKARELVAQAVARAGATAATPGDGNATAPMPAKLRVGILSVTIGKTEQSQYILTSKLTVIGKSEMASIRLKRWFAPKVAASITRRNDAYFITPADNKQKVKVNGYPVLQQWELQPGDKISVAKVEMSFSYND